MALYKVLQDSIVNNCFYEAGSTVDYDLPEGSEVGSNLELVEAPKASRGRAAADAE